MLGPVTFNIYVNDMPVQVNNPVFQFTDDLKIFRVIHNVEDFQQLQNDINKSVAWVNKWQLKFKISIILCYLLHLGKSHGYGECNIQGITITSTDTIKDLGVIIDNNLKFHAHTESVTSKANRTLTNIRKIFQFKNNHIFITLYKTLVRPVIEYGNSI